MNFRNLSLFLLAAPAFAGCAGTPDSRIAHTSSAFSSWPPDVQAAVRAGHIGVGYTPDQVWVALGQPARRTVVTTAAGVSEVWIYAKRGPSFSFGIGVGGGGARTGFGGAVAVNDVHPYAGPVARIVFTNGAVSEIDAPR